MVPIIMKEAEKDKDSKITILDVTETLDSSLTGLVAIKIAEEVVDPDDIEMLEDLIMAATNEAFRAMESDSQAQLSKLTGGLGGGFGF